MPPSSLQLRILDESAIDASLDQRIRNFLALCFPKDADAFALSRGWHGSMPVFSVLLEDEGELIAHASVVDRVVSAGNDNVRVAGVQNVCVRPDRRGGGLVDRVMLAATEEARQRGFDGGLLFCVSALCPIYCRTGWQQLARRTLIRRDQAGQESPVQTTDEAMYFPLKRPAFPPGDIRLNGNDW
jgi:predicted N-acetyltransferase YhbS